MIKCEICHEDYQEGQLELHRQTCVLQLLFRCSICNEDYVSREGMWNHLDQHEVLDDSKELHCQELKAKHKLYQCAKCNDQRGYSESCYRVHVQNLHDHCLAQDQTIPSDFNGLVEEPVSANIEDLAFDNDHLEQSWTDPNKKHPHWSATKHDKADAATGPANESKVEEECLENKEENCTKHHETTKPAESKIKCKICGQRSRSRNALRYHKTISHTEPQYECPHCQKKFHFAGHQKEHEKGCAELRCFKCDIKFRQRSQLNRHKCGEFLQNGDKPKVRRTKSVRRQYARPVRNGAGDLLWPCLICKVYFHKRRLQHTHVLKAHTKPTHKCLFCQRTFHFVGEHRCHEKWCSGMQHHEYVLYKQNIKKLTCPKKTEEHDECPLGWNNPTETSNVEQTDSSTGKIVQEKCFTCKATFAGIEDVIDHVSTCPKKIINVDSQMSSAKIAQIPSAMGSQTNRNPVLQGENTGLEMDIKVEESILHDL